MNRLIFNRAGALALLWLVLSTPFANASDQWRISEVFSNSDGKLQYIVLTTEASDQDKLSGVTITSRNASGDAENSFTFSDDIDASTADSSLLLGTSSLAEHAGLAVDFEIPAGFVFRDGGSIDYAGVDELSYQASELPKNGQQALRGDLSVVDAMPENFAGQSATVETPVISWLEQSTLSVHLPVVDVAGIGTVNASLSVTDQDPFELTLSSAYLYEEGIIAGDSAPSLNEAGTLYIPAAEVGDQLFEVNFSLQNDVNFIFGGLEVLSIQDLMPEPEPDPLEASINAGEEIFAQICASCHGASGNGTIQGPSLINASRTSFEELRPFIESNMPQTSPGECTDSGDSSCATDAANFILHEIQQ